MQIVEALEIENSDGRYRATLRHTDPVMSPQPLCSCETGHGSEAGALLCSEATANTPALLRPPAPTPTLRSE